MAMFQVSGSIVITEQQLRIFLSDKAPGMVSGYVCHEKEKQSWYVRARMTAKESIWNVIMRTIERACQYTNSLKSLIIEPVRATITLHG